MSQLIVTAMSGHSKWATTHRQKEAKDAKKGAVFTKLANIVILAAREGGGDLNSNFKLRLAVEKAKSANMPKDNIERAIKRGSGEASDGVIIEEIAYEAFGPAGTALIIEVITDNKNRALSEIKAVFNKFGGQLAGPNSVLWLFEKRGVIVLDPSESGRDLDELELAIIDAGAQDIIKNDVWEIQTAGSALQAVTENLKKLNFNLKDSVLAYVAKDPLTITDLENQEKIQKLLTALDDLNEVSNVYTNATW